MEHDELEHHAHQIDDVVIGLAQFASTGFAGHMGQLVFQQQAHIQMIHLAVRVFIVNGMGLAEWIHGLGGPRRLLASNFNEVILNITTWFIGVVNNVLGTYFNAPTMLDVSLPSIMYDSVLVQNPQLIDLLSPDYSKIEPMSESFNGKAKDSTGNVTLMMATKTPGPNTLI